MSIDVCLYGWVRIGSVLFPSKHLLDMPYEYYITCGCVGSTRHCSCRSIGVVCTKYSKCGDNCKKISRLFCIFLVHNKGTSNTLTGSNMELFVKLLTNLKKNSILDVVGAIDPLLHRIYFTHNRTTLLFWLWTIFVLEPRYALPSLKIKGFCNTWTKGLWK